MESKIYTVVSKQNIELWIDSLGNYKVADEVFDILSEDVTYRLRELVHSSLKYMKHSRRRCLTVDDLNHSLRESDTKLIFGHSGSDNLSFKSINLKEGPKFCYTEEKDLNLRECALDPSLPTEQTEIALKASWLVLEGHPCSSGRMKDESKYTLINPSVSYLQKITAAIFGSGEHLRKVALDDLKTNKKLQIMIPHLVTFCSLQIKQHTGKDTFCQVSTYILSTIDSIVKNPSVILTSYVVQLAKMMLFVLIEAKIHVSKWFIKNKASKILALLSKRDLNTYNNVTEQLLKAYTASLNDDSKPFTCLYGAVVGIKDLGLYAVNQGLYPKARDKLKMIDSKMNGSLNHLEKTELMAVMNAIVDALAILYKPRSELNKSIMAMRKSYNFSLLNGDLINVVGESFLARCMIVTHHAPKIPPTQPTTLHQNKSDSNDKDDPRKLNGLSKESARSTVGEALNKTKNFAEKLERKYTVETSVGTVDISDKPKVSSLRKIRHSNDDSESSVFEGTLKVVKKRKATSHGFHGSLRKKRKRETNAALCRISTHLPNF